SWNEVGEEAVRRFKKGDELDTVILSVDPERERISLGIKQLDSDPFTTFATVNDKGQIVTGKVKTVDAKGAEIDLGEDILGYLRVSELSRDRVEDARSILKEGDEVTAVVISVDRKTRNIQLSIKQKDMVEQQEAMASLSAQSSKENAGTTSLGALLRAKLDADK
ncbi:MAG: S1 RNA-binding domain-containing protein, partial [Comamonas sp.]